MLKNIAILALFTLFASSTFGIDMPSRYPRIKQADLKKLWDMPEENAAALVDKMDIRAQIGQVLMLDIRNWGVDNQKNPINMTILPDDLADVLSRYKIGSLALFRENLIDTYQSYNLTNTIQTARYQLPIMLAVDQEGGYVTRLREGTEMPGNMALAATRQPDLAEKTGKVHGAELSALGFHLNFAPVIDINSNQKNPVIGVRSYGDNVDLINAMASAYIKGLHSKKIMATAKHFPGHGNVATDSHIGLPTVSYSMDEWRKTDLMPFKAAIANSVDMIMTAHIVFPALDDTQVISKKDGTNIGLPATLSKKIITGILRDELGFKGLILTDALDMGAIVDNFGNNEAVEMALLAGVDIAVMPLHIWDAEGLQKLENLYIYLEQQSSKNPELAARIKAAALNVVTHKLKNKLNAENISSAQYAKDIIVASRAHKDFEKLVARESITLIENQAILPYELKKETSILIISDESARNELIKNELNNIDNELAAVSIKTTSSVFNLANGTIPDNLFTQIEKNDFIILVTYNLTSIENKAQKVIEYTEKSKKPLVVISSRNPYDIAYLKGVKANIAIYGITGFDITNNSNLLEANIKAGIRSLFTYENQNAIFNKPKGKLPVEIRSYDNKTVIYPYGHGLSY